MAAPKHNAGRDAGDTRSVYDIYLPVPQDDVYDILGAKPRTRDEQYMLDRFHEQSDAVQGHHVLGRQIDTRVGDLARHTVYQMGTTMETVEDIEYAANLERLQPRLQDFDNKVLDQTGRLMLETNAIAVRTMHETMRRDVYAPPPKEKRKGALRGLGEFFFGER